MESNFHICATRLARQKNGHLPIAIRFVARFLMSCKKACFTSRHKSLASKGFSHVVLPTVLTDGVLPTWQTTSPDLNGEF